MKLSELESRLKKQANKTVIKENVFWKPTDEHVVRLFPNPHGNPIHEVAIHYNVGKSSVLCPKQFGHECKICDYCNSLYSFNYPDGTKKSPEVKNEHFFLKCKLNVVSSFCVPVVERKMDAETNDALDELKNEEPLWWKLSESQLSQVLEICKRPDRQKACKIKDKEEALQVVLGKNAFDLTVSFKKANNEDKKGNEKNKPSITISGALMVNSIFEDEKKLQKLYSKVKKIEEIFPQQTSEEVSVLLEKFINECKENTEPKKELKSDAPTDNYESNNAEDVEKIGKQDIEEKFAAMMAETN